jgi:HD-GYP domain-containing protein (c-di-GMP phosphodiesterase class II)
MLTVPLISQRDEVIGIIQLINRKSKNVRLLTKADVEEHVIPFDDRAIGLVEMLAAQAGVSLENALLYQEISRLFDGFVRASVDAIESRDPTTSGHSRRVANLTVNLARVVSDQVSTGPYATFRASPSELRELEYAGLLHDFGKIGVKEEVLVKAKKLYGHQLELVRARFAQAKQALEIDFLRRKVSLIERGGAKDDLEMIEGEFAVRLAELEAELGVIETANEPSVLAEGDFAKIAIIAQKSFCDCNGKAQPLLAPNEVEALSVRKGSLTAAEYREITSHVTHTIGFLSKIPWGKQFRRVAEIAGAHHEKLNGKGYPFGLSASQIPTQSKMMAITDIFDALTASDRPYKRAMPTEKALEILDFSVKDEHVDGELVRIFREARVWER